MDEPTDPKSQPKRVLSDEAHLFEACDETSPIWAELTVKGQDRQSGPVTQFFTHLSEPADKFRLW